MELANIQHLELPPGRRVLVISDIHGNLAFLKALLAQVGFCRTDILIILGDLLEKGVESLAALRYVMELSKDYEVHMVCGNCDNLAYNFVDQPSDIPEDFYISYLHGWGEKSVLRQMADEAGSRCGGGGFPTAAGENQRAFSTGARVSARAAHYTGNREVYLCPRRCVSRGTYGDTVSLAVHEK